MSAKLQQQSIQQNCCLHMHMENEPLPLCLCMCGFHTQLEALSVSEERFGGEIARILIQPWLEWLYWVCCLWSKCNFWAYFAVLKLLWLECPRPMGSVHYTSFVDFGHVIGLDWDPAWRETILCQFWFANFEVVSKVSFVPARHS